jgi:predicted TIM-barrel fold metal-dependent hydrolase
LAKYENVYVKFSGAPTWSREPFPFADVWRHVEPVFEAFGVRRLMWGSDFTHLGARIPYADAVGFVLATPTLSRSEKEALMGGTLERVFRWEPANREPMGTGGSDPAPTV